MPIIGPHRERKPRRPSLKAALAEAAAAKLPVRRVRIEADAVVIDVGEPAADETEANPWDEHLTRLEKEKQK